MSLCGLLRAGLDADPDGLALISADTRWTWGTLDGLSDRLAHSLLGLGLNPGDRVASLMPNRPALDRSLPRLFQSGLVATPLNYRYMAPEIDHALAVSAARCPVRARRAGGRSRRKRARPAAAAWADQLRGDSRTGPAFDELTEGEAPSARSPPPSPAAPAVIFFTSGSTGRPKGVTHYPRDARLDARDGVGRPRVQRGRPAAGGLVAVARWRLLCLVRRAGVGAGVDRAPDVRW